MDRLGARATPWVMWAERRLGFTAAPGCGGQGLLTGAAPRHLHLERAVTAPDGEVGRGPLRAAHRLDGAAHAQLGHGVAVDLHHLVAGREPARLRRRARTEA